MEDLCKLNNLLIRNGTYYFKVRVPQDLLASIGKKEIKVSLKTKDPREIKSKLALETLKAEASFKAARRALAPLPEIPNPTQILAAAKEHQTITTSEIDRIANGKTANIATIDTLINLIFSGMRLSILYLTVY